MDENEPQEANDSLPPEVLAVLRISPNVNPCLKFRRVDIVRFVEHINEGKCRQCLTFFSWWEKELRMMKLRVKESGSGIPVALTQSILAIDFPIRVNAVTEDRLPFDSKDVSVFEDCIDSKIF